MYTAQISSKYYFVTLQPAVGECALISYFYLIIKICSFFNYRRPTMGLPANRLM